MDGSMAHRHGRSWFRISARLGAGVVVSLAILAGSAHGHGGGGGGGGGGHGGGGGLHYKGSETLSLVSVAPNLERCGEAPNFEAVFEGSGIDTAGGVFTVESSGCQNVATGLVFDLVATDTYANGDSVDIVADSFTLVFDPETCVSSTVDSVHFDIDGGTGAFAGASGGGKFDFASNDPACSGVISPAFVWFRGKIHT